MKERGGRERKNEEAKKNTSATKNKKSPFFQFTRILFLLHPTPARAFADL